jgi:hypothetical protein
MSPIYLERASGAGDGRSLRQHEKRRGRVGFEGEHIFMTRPEQLCDGGCRAVAEANLDDLGRVSEEECSLLKIGVFRGDDQSMLGSVGPDDLILGRGEINVSDMD